MACNSPKKPLVDQQLPSCKILQVDNTKKQHCASILGKFLPRGRIFLERSPGLPFFYSYLMQLCYHYINYVLFVVLFAGVGIWDWGTCMFFLRFPCDDAPPISMVNSAANMQIFVELLDNVNEVDATRISSYLWLIWYII